MKNLRTLISLLVIMLALRSSALPQTADSQNTSDRANLIVAARCQYTPVEDACAGVSDSSQDRSRTNDDGTLAQLPRRGPGPPFRPRGPMGHPHRAYPPLWMEPYNSHATVGALIGFSLGAAAGAGANTDARGRVAASLLVGSIGALLGAAVGHTIPVFHLRRPYQRGPWPDDDELASRRKAAKPDAIQQRLPEQTASAIPAPSRNSCPTRKIPLLPPTAAPCLDFGLTGT